MFAPIKQFDSKKIERANLIIRALHHKYRMKILEKLVERPYNVTDLVKVLNADQSVVSQHLAILRREKFVIDTRKGRKITYSVNVKRFEELNEALAIIIQ